MKLYVGLFGLPLLELNVELEQRAADVDEKLEPARPPLETVSVPGPGSGLTTDLGEAIDPVTRVVGFTVPEDRRR